MQRYALIFLATIRNCGDAYGLVHVILPKCTVWYTKRRSCGLNHRNLSGCKVKHNRLNYNDFIVVFARSLQGLYVVFGTIFVDDDFLYHICTENRPS